MMLVEETTIPAAALPVIPFKEYLRLGTGFADDALQDSVLDSFLRAALAAIEARTGKILLRRDFSWSLTAWRDVSGQVLPVAPISRVVSVERIDAAGVVTTIDPADLILERDHQRPKLVPVATCLPTIPTHGTMSIRFEAGFAVDFTDLPADLAQAVLMLAAHYYENRNALGIPDTSMPFGVLVLIERYKTLRILGGTAS